MNASRRISIAVGLSLLAHVLILALPPHQPTPPPPRAMAATPLTVRITPAELPREPEPPEPPREIAPPRPAPPPRVAPPKVAPRRVEPPAVAPPAMPQPPVAADASPPRVRPPPAVDMLAMIEARREQRRAQSAPAPAPVEKPAEDAASRNLATLTGREGVGGVFEILRIGTRTAAFAFNGWRPEARSQWRVVIEVDAGQGGNVELAMVRRMIALIREHYEGDFNWESHRLGRTVVMSARPEHGTELEDFLMLEFFGTQTLNPRRPRQQR